MQADRIAQLLPEVYRRAILPGTPLAALLEVMQEQHDPVERVLRNLPEYFDPQRAPDRFVPFLAVWVDLARWLNDGTGTFDAGQGRLRQVVAAAAQLSRLRGTSEGLRLALEVATGVAGVSIDDEGRDGAGRARPFHAVVRLPESARLHEALVRRIVMQEKPAHVTVEVVFADTSGSEVSAAPPTETASSLPPPTLPVSSPARSEPAFPGTEPAPVMTRVPSGPEGER